MQMMKVERGTTLILELEVIGNLPKPIFSGYAINVRGDDNIGQETRTNETKRRRWMTTTVHNSFVGRKHTLRVDDDKNRDLYLLGKHNKMHYVSCMGMVMRDDNIT